MPAICARIMPWRRTFTPPALVAAMPPTVALPLAVLPKFVAEASSLAARVAPGARTIIFGHLADGNMHVNILGLSPDDERATEAILARVAELGGSISAEHGIGRAKARWLSLTRSPADIAAMRAIKRALDPKGLLNPGVIFER